MTKQSRDKLFLIFSLLILAAFSCALYKENKEKNKEENEIEIEIDDEAIRFLKKESKINEMAVIDIKISNYDLNNPFNGLFFDTKIDNNAKKTKIAIVDNNEIILKEDAKILLSGTSTRRSNIYKKKSFEIIREKEEINTSANNKKWEQFLTKRNLKLHSGGQDQNNGNIRTKLINDQCMETTFDGCRDLKYIIVYINEEKYAIETIQEGITQSTLAERFNLKDENKIHIYKGTEQEALTKSGIMQYFTQNLKITDNKEHLESRVDVGNLIQYYAIEYIINNMDWPMNNYCIWNYDGEKTANKYTDGKYRFILYDVDLSYCNDSKGQNNPKCKEETLEEKTERESIIFKKILEIPEYKEIFMETIRDYTAKSFSDTEMVKRIKKIESETEKAHMLINDYKNLKTQNSLLQESIEDRNKKIKDRLEK